MSGIICPNCGGWLSLHKNNKPCNSDVMEIHRKNRKYKKKKQKKEI